MIADNNREEDKTPASGGASETLQVEVVKKVPPRFKRQTKINKAKGAENDERVWQLVIRKGVSIPDAAKQLGMGTSSAYRCFDRKMERLLSMEPAEPAKQAQLRLETEQHLRHILSVSKEQCDDPRHAVVALKTLEQLSRLYGLDKPAQEDTGSDYSREEVAARVRLLSPALEKHAAQIERALLANGKVSVPDQSSSSSGT